MNKGALIFSFLLNVVLLLGMVFLHFYDVSSCSNEGYKEEKKGKSDSHTMVCTQVDDEDDSVTSRVEFTYDDEGTITSLKVGEATHYAVKEDYDTALNSDGKNEDLGNQTVFHYTETDGTVKDEAGNVHYLWFKEMANNYQRIGYTCQ